MIYALWPENQSFEVEDVPIEQENSIPLETAQENKKDKSDKRVQKAGFWNTSPPFFELQNVLGLGLTILIYSLPPSSLQNS